MEPQLEALLELVRDLAAILSISWDNTPQDVIKGKINKAIYDSLEKVV